jgi:hypothetical protein
MASNDEIEMAERIGQLQEENQRLKADLRAMTVERNKASLKAWIDNGWICFGIFLGVVFLLAVAYKGIFTPAVVDYCYLVRETHVGGPDTFILKGHIPWTAEDLQHGEFKSIEEGVRAAGLLQCPLKK